MAKKDKAPKKLDSETEKHQQPQEVEKRQGILRKIFCFTPYEITDRERNRDEHCKDNQYPDEGVAVPVVFFSERVIPVGLLVRIILGKLFFRVIV